MKKSRAWILLLAAGFVSGCFFASANQAQVPDAGVSRGEDPVAVDSREDGSTRNSVILPVTLNLEFTVQAGQEAHRFSVVCASDRYSILTVQSSDAGERSIRVQGHVYPRDDGGFLLHFDASFDIEDRNNGTANTFSAEGSTFVGLDRPTKLVSFPGPTLEVIATVVETDE